MLCCFAHLEVWPCDFVVLPFVSAAIPYQDDTLLSLLHALTPVTPLFGCFVLGCVLLWFGGFAFGFFRERLSARFFQQWGSVKHLLIFTSSSHLIFTSAHLHICSSSHLPIFTSFHLYILSSHPLIFTSFHLHICSSSHLLIFTSSQLHIFSHLLTFSHAFFLSFSLKAEGGAGDELRNVNPFARYRTR